MNFGGSFRKDGVKVRAEIAIEVYATSVFSCLLANVSKEFYKYV